MIFVKRVLMLATSMALVITTVSLHNQEISPEKNFLSQSASISDVQQQVQVPADSAVSKIRQVEYQIKVTKQVGETVPTLPAVEEYDDNRDAALKYAEESIDDENQWRCLFQLWNKESGWRVNASNGSSGAYGIPQAYPGEKMKTAGDDWKTNYKTQIDWGLSYIKNSRYKTPCAAWKHSEKKGWY